MTAKSPLSGGRLVARTVTVRNNPEAVQACRGSQVETGCARNWPLSGECRLLQMRQDRSTVIIGAPVVYGKPYVMAPERSGSYAYAQ